jgi:predicted nucleic acid-binding protein
MAGTAEFGIRRIVDARLALTLRHHGVTVFATSNVKDFEGFGFTRVWNPLLTA